MKHYVINDDRCLLEAYDKTEVDNIITDEHNNNAKWYFNKNNDIAFMTAEAYITSGHTSAFKDFYYPDGFTKDNCTAIITLDYSASAGNIMCAGKQDGKKLSASCWATNTQTSDTKVIFRVAFIKVPLG